ncbi:DUF1631 family protein [Noviherbaspirillum sp. ST9]|uniref:DUF1631 family protein n=1 Tax=Noviherbaspirillum sp. ST9 TaxID=3401606 RepID=UPI003B5882CC
MSDPHTHRTAGKAAITPDRLALLHTLAFAALRLCAAQREAFTARLEQALSARSGDAESHAERILFRAAHQQLQAHCGTFQRLVADALQRALMQAIQDTADDVAYGVDRGALDLSLITFEAMERKVIVDNLSQAIDRTGAEELAVLSLRVSHWLGADDIGALRNPFRSEVFLKAVADAWFTFDPMEETHRLVLRQMDPQVFLDLLPVWKALNQELALRHVLPDAEQAFRKRAKGSDSIPPPPADETLRQWLAPEGVLKVIDARAASLADELFVFLSNLDAVPVRIRRLLACLETPLKQAILDDSQFFFELQHPVRRVLEGILAAGLGCRKDEGEDRLFPSIEAQCARVPSAALAQYKAIAEELVVLADHEDRLLDDKLIAAVADAVTQENVAQAERRAEQDVLARIESGEADPLIESFLRAQWTRVLAFAHGVRDAKPDVLQKALEAMDELLGSVKPRTSAEARKELVARLPALLSMLNAWLNVVKWEGPERDLFFDNLASRHAASMRGADIDARQALERRMDTVERASEHRLERRAQEQRAEAFAPFMQEIDELGPGAWFEFVRNDGSKVNCKLLWTSPGSSRFIFAGKQGQRLFTLDREGLAQGMLAERVARLPAGEFVSRAIAAALQKISGAENGS